MRLVVVDTNVVISAGINPAGAPARLIHNYVLGGEVQVAICPCIAGEYREVARREKLARYGFPPSWLELLIAISFELRDPPDWPYELPDPKDEAFLSLAHASGAWLVTGNLKHFPRSARRAVTVISPAEYLERLGAV